MWFLAESSSVNCSWSSCHLRTLLEKRTWWGALEVKGAPESAGTSQSGGKQRKHICMFSVSDKQEVILISKLKVEPEEIPLKHWYKATEDAFAWGWAY